MRAPTSPAAGTPMYRLWHEEAITVAFAAALLGGATSADASSSAPSSRAVAWVTVGSIAATVPAGFHYRYFTSCSYPVTGSHGACAKGAVVADYRLRPQ